MPFDGLAFRRMTSILNETLYKARINKIVQPSPNDLLFLLHKNGTQKQLLISTHASNSYISLTSNKYNQNIDVTHFLSIMRKHLEGGEIQEIIQLNNDRILRVTIQKHNEIKDLVTKYLYVELTGKFTNIILTKDDNVILDAFNRIPPLESTARTIHPGAVYRLLPFPHKKDPLVDQYDPTISLSAQFHGISLPLEKEIEYRIQNGQNFKDIINEILTSNHIYISEGKKKDYHFIPFLHFENKYEKYELTEGIDKYYFEKLEIERLKQKRANINKVCKKELTKNINKLEKLNLDYQNSVDAEKYKYYGDLIFTYAMGARKGLDSIKVYDEILETEVIIPLDEKLDIVRNANKYYQRYQKGQKSLKIIEEQIEKTKEDIKYFEFIMLQLEESDNESFEQIKEELTNLGYLKAEVKKHPKSKKNKPKTYNPQEYFSPTNIKISVGRNNYQNEYLTFQVARNNETFMHVKEFAGSHVIIHSPILDEPTIRMAANLAAYYSKARYSSSVPVDYTLVKHVKKIPGAKPGKVLMTNFKTIYIDPEEIK